MNHDPMCRGGASFCDCPLIARVREDERARMTGAKPSGMSDLTVTDSPHD